MIRWVLNTLGRILPAGIPICFLLIAVCLFYSQNNTTCSRQGDFTLMSADEMSERFPTRVSDDADRYTAGETNSQKSSTVPVARKYVLTRRAGLVIGDRGHSASFAVDIPEFIDDSPFLRQLSQQLRHEYEQAAAEFTTMDWSLVLDGLRDPQPYLRNWEGVLGIDVVHLSPQAASVLESRWDYTGGAHGNSILTGRCFVESKGQVRQLKLDDLFDPMSDWAKRLIAFCLSDLRCQGASSISDVCVEDPESITFSTDDLASFTLSTGGLTFYFSPYHVGCYAEGIYTVRVPYAVIRDCLLDDSPARLFMSADNR